MTDLHTSITTTIGHLDWCTTIPHTLDQLVGLATEALSDQHPALPVSHGATIAEIVQAFDDRRARAGTGHIGPPGAATHGPDADLGSLDAAVNLIATKARAVLDRTTTALDLEPWTPRSTWFPDPTGKITDAVAHLHRAHPHVADAAARDHELVHLVRTELGETAEWLHGKALAIWHASKGETKTPAVQRSIAECKHCSSWRTATMATTDGLCSGCATFRHRQRCLPTEAIVRRWDIGKGATPGQIIEAKAHARTKGRKTKVS